MKLEEAIMIMENEMPSCGDKLTFTSEECYEAYQMAIEALKKQMPLRVDEFKTAEVGTKYGFCHHCGKYVGDFEKYCINCGQAIDWSDAEQQESEREEQRNGGIEMKFKVGDRIRYCYEDSKNNGRLGVVIGVADSAQFPYYVSLDRTDTEENAVFWTSEDVLEPYAETFRDRLKREHPEWVDGDFVGGCALCPCDYGYESEPEYCNDGDRPNCYKCWNRPIPKQTESEQPAELTETKTEEKSKKKVYAIFYERFFFGNHYDRYIRFVETEDIFHEVGVLIYKASTAVKNIRWCEMPDEPVKAAIARHLREYDNDWERLDGTDILRFIGKE